MVTLYTREQTVKIEEEHQYLTWVRHTIAVRSRYRIETIDEFQSTYFVLDSLSNTGHLPLFYLKHLYGGLLCNCLYRHWWIFTCNINILRLLVVAGLNAAQSSLPGSSVMLSLIHLT